MNSNNNEQGNSSNKFVQRKKFSEEFDQLLSVEISPGLWIAVQKPKRNGEVFFVDIRRKKEGMWQGNKIFIPTKAGLFLRSAEYDKLKHKLETFVSATLNHFEFADSIGWFHRITTENCS